MFGNLYKTILTLRDSLWIVKHYEGKAKNENQCKTKFYFMPDYNWTKT